MAAATASPAEPPNPELNATPPPKRSVYKINPVADGAIIGTTALANLVAYAFGDHWISKRCPCDPAEVNSFDRGAIGNQNATLDSLSDATAAVAIAGPVAGDFADLGWSKELLEDMVVYAEVLSVNGAFTTLAKYTVQRPLPRVYAGQDPELESSAGGYRSFYSGHASTTFASLTAASITLNLRHDAGIWPWLVTLGVGGSVAYERVAAGRHFPTDVIMGAVAGTVVGVAVPWLHKRGSEHGLSLMPMRDGLGIAWNRRF